MICTTFCVYRVLLACDSDLVKFFLAKGETGNARAALRHGILREDKLHTYIRHSAPSPFLIVWDCEESARARQYVTHSWSCGTDIVSGKQACIVVSYVRMRRWRTYREQKGTYRDI